MKEPHNYRKVGYSMIVISVSLTVIGLVVWAIGNDYHYSSNLMAGQEIDAMTPKQGYNIISFDHTAPVGAKLKLVDHADSADAAKTLQDQYQQSSTGPIILTFGNSADANLDLTAHAEVYALTPAKGYNVVFFNQAMPVGAKLALSIHNDLLVNATQNEQKQQAANKDPDVTVIVLDSSYDDNLKTVLGPSASDIASFQPPKITSLVTATVTQPIINSTTSSNETIGSAKLNATNTTSEVTQKVLPITEQVNMTTNQTNQTVTNGTHKSVDLSENIGVTAK